MEECLCDLRLVGDLSTHAFVSLVVPNRGVRSLDEITEWPFLEKIDASHNDLCTSSPSSSPSESGLKPLESLQYLAKLNLSHNQKIESFPGFRAPTTLHELDYSNNGIRSIDDNVKSLRYVSRIDLHANQLSDIALLSTLSTLTFLDLSNNSLSEDALPHLNLPCLAILNLAHNSINSVRLLPSLPSCQQLNLSHNSIESLSNIPHDSVARVSRLDLGANKFHDFNEAKALCHLSRLEHLSLQSNPCTLSEKYRLAVIYILPRLTSLDDQQTTPAERLLSRHSHGDFESELAAIKTDLFPLGLRDTSLFAYHRTHCLQGADVLMEPDSYEVTEKGVSELGLLSGWLEHLEGMVVGVGGDGDNQCVGAALNIDRVALHTQGLMSVCEVMNRRDDISQLRIADSVLPQSPSLFLKLKDSICRPVFGHRSRSPSLCVLDLSGCNLAFRVCAVVAEIVEQCPTLCSLNVSGNWFGQHATAISARHVVAAAQWSASAHHTADNESSQGTQSSAIIEECPALQKLMNALARNANVTHLDLSYNRIDDAGVTVIAKGLASTNLRSFAIGGNHNISFVGGTVLARSLRDNTTIVQLSLASSNSECKHDPQQFALFGEFVQAIMHCLTHYNRKISDLNVSGLYLSEATVKSIHTLFADRQCCVKNLHVDGCTFDDANAEAAVQQVSSSVGEKSSQIPNQQMSSSIC